MSTKKTTLGRGLTALLGAVPTTLPETPPPASGTNLPSTGSQPMPKNGDLCYLPLDLIQRSPHQPRKAFNQEALQELADSIRVKGVIQPIVVRRTNGTHYELIAGERRWRAAQLAQLPNIPAIVRELSEIEVMALALIENIQREDLNPIEEAQALQRLLTEFELTHEQVAEMIGKSRVTVTNLLRLTHLEAPVQQMLMDGALEMGHARALLALEKATQVDAAHSVAKKGMSVRQTEALVRRMTGGSPQKGKKKENDPNLTSLQNQLAEKLKAPVTIQTTREGKGRLIIEYHSLEELQGIIDSIR